MTQSVLTIRTCLWFENGGLEAAQFYTSLLPNSKIETAHKLGQAEPLLVDFVLNGAPYQILNGGPHFKLTEAASISVAVDDQTQIDELWRALIADGGQESQCGWLKDRWGVSWQIYPHALLDMQSSEDQQAAERVRQAMYKMKKIELALLNRAFEQR